MITHGTARNGPQMACRALGRALVRGGGVKPATGHGTGGTGHARVARDGQKPEILRRVGNSPRACPHARTNMGRLSPVASRSIKPILPTA